MTTATELSGFITRDDQARSPYHYIPFLVPEGIRRLTVRFDYADGTGTDEPGAERSVSDLGVFDSGGVGWMSAGFRGWSGDARRAFTITPRSATPGYLPGPLPSGEWHVALGLYMVAAGGSRYEIAVVFNEDAPGVEELALPRERERVALRSGPGWYRGDLQSHSYHSDGRGSLDALVESARHRGLDFLAVTEHNTVSHWPFLPHLEGDGLLLIPGEEVTTYRGHMNVWGAQSWLDFRCRTPEDVERVIEEARRQGALCSVNHPKDTGTDWLFPDELPTDAWEVWNGPWWQRNNQALTRWDRQLRLGRRVVAVGGSDYHQPGPGGRTEDRPGVPTTWVYAAELSVSGILSGLRGGRVCVSEDVGGPRLDLTATLKDSVAHMGSVLRIPPPAEPVFRCEVTGGAGGLLRLIGKEGVLLETPVGDDETVWEGALSVTLPGYVRAELLHPADGGMRAIGNPIYLLARE